MLTAEKGGGEAARSSSDWRCIGALHEACRATYSKVVTVTRIVTESIVTLMFSSTGKATRAKGAIKTKKGDAPDGHNRDGPDAISLEGRPVGNGGTQAAEHRPAQRTTQQGCS